MWFSSSKVKPSSVCFCEIISLISLTTSFNLVVNPVQTITTQPLATQEICVDGTVTPFTIAYSGGLGTPSVQWYSNTTNSNSGGTIINGATNRNYTPITSEIGTLYYYVVVSGTTGPSTVTSNVSGAVTVSAVPTISIQTPSAGICTGASVTFSSTVSGSPTYQWKKNGTNIMKEKRKKCRNQAKNI